MANLTKVYYDNQWREVSSFGDSKPLPDVLTPNRAYIMHLDCGRKYFTIPWIEGLIDYLSSIGYSELHLHLSEEMAFRIESKLYPWLAGSYISLCVRKLGQVDPDEGRYYTQEEISNIVRYAASKNIEIVPSFDTPGHMNYILTKWEEQYGTENTIRNYYTPRESTIASLGNKYTGPISNNGLDLTNPVGIEFTMSLMREMAELFFDCGCRKFDIGGDELLSYGAPLASGQTRWRELTAWDAYAKTKFGNDKAVAFDLYVDWMNSLYDMLYNIGYSMVYMWNDVYGITGSSYTNWSKVKTLTNKITFLWWTSSAGKSITLSDAIARGHHIINCPEKYNYYVLTPNYTQPKTSTYKEHDSTDFYYTTTDYRDSAVVGTMFCLWCDNPVQDTEDNVMAAIQPLLKAKIDRREK